MNRGLFFFLLMFILAGCSTNSQETSPQKQLQVDTIAKLSVEVDTQKTAPILQLDTLWCLNCIEKLATESTELEANRFLQNQIEMGDTLKRCFDLSYSFDSITTTKYIVLLLLKKTLVEVQHSGTACEEMRMCGSFRLRYAVDSTCTIPYYFFKYFNILSDDVEHALSSLAYKYAKKDKKFLKYKPITTLMNKIDKAEIEYDKKKH